MPRMAATQLPVVNVGNITLYVACQRQYHRNNAPPARKDAYSRHFLTAQLRRGYFDVPKVLKRLLNLANWPPLSLRRWTPVQAGWVLGSISRRSVSPVLP